MLGKCVCVCVHMSNQGMHILWDKLSLQAYGDKFDIHLDSQVRTLEGITVFPNTSFINYKAFGNMYFSCIPYMVFAISS